MCHVHSHVWSSCAITHQAYLPSLGTRGTRACSLGGARTRPGAITVATCKDVQEVQGCVEVCKGAWGGVRVCEGV